MDTTGTKILAMCLLGGISIILGFIPLKLGKVFKGKDGDHKHGTIFSSLLCFGGGVLLATSLLHMLPEVRESFEHADILPEGKDHMPIAEIILMCGFFLIYFIEELVHFMCDNDLHGDARDAAVEKCVVQVCVDETKVRKTSVGVHRAFSRHSLSCDHTEMHEKQARKSDTTIWDQPEVPITSSQDREKTTKSDYHTFDRSSGASEHIGHSHDDSHADHSHQENGVKVKNGRRIALRDFFTVLALSFHAIFEGLAIGLEEHEEDIWILFAAVATHKYVISFCVGMELYNADTPKKIYAAYMLVYALMTSIGIAIGIVITTVTENDPNYLLTTGILQALAGGTILYVVVFEVLQREKSKEKVPGLVQLFCVMLGFSALMLVEILAPHEHGGDEEGMGSTAGAFINTGVITSLAM